MDNEVKTWLKDIEQAIIEINSFIPEIKNFKDFQKDKSLTNIPLHQANPQLA
jgi:hypothetical protein